MAWTIDPGGGSAPVSGTDLGEAVLEHAYPPGQYRPGQYRATLTVTDDSGRSASASATVVVSGDGR